MFLVDFCKLNKTPSNGTFLGEPPEGYCDVGCCCCFTSPEVFHPFLFDVMLPWAIARFLHPFYTFSSAHRRAVRDTFILTFLVFFVTDCFTTSATVLSERFLSTDDFYLALLSHILVRFVTQMRARTPMQGPHLCLPS